jgi:hypothetical protein
VFSAYAYSILLRWRLKAASPPTSYAQGTGKTLNDVYNFTQRTSMVRAQSQVSRWNPQIVSFQGALCKAEEEVIALYFMDLAYCHYTRQASTCQVQKEEVGTIAETIGL